MVMASSFVKQGHKALAIIGGIPEPAAGISYIKLRGVGEVDFNIHHAAIHLCGTDIAEGDIF